MPVETSLMLAHTALCQYRSGSLFERDKAINTSLNGAIKVGEEARAGTAKALGFVDRFG